MEKLEKAANKWLKPYPNAAWRENVEVLLVALAVAMGIRTFFLQPFKIPTGSMQPTLFGVTSENLSTSTGLQDSHWLDAGSGVVCGRVLRSRGGARMTGLEAVEPPANSSSSTSSRRSGVGGKTYTIWFPPDYGGRRRLKDAPACSRQSFHKGDDIVKLKVSAGDHLFVDRMTYNFRPPNAAKSSCSRPKASTSLPPGPVLHQTPGRPGR